MEEIKRYKLESKKALDFIKWSLDEVNILSEGVLSNTPFDKGEFFTYLNDGVDEKKLHGFKYGGFATNVEDEILSVILSKLKEANGCYGIFDAFNHDYDPSYKWELFDKVGLHRDKEMYFSVHKEMASEVILKSCFQASDCTWHSLCVLSSYPYKRSKDQSISKEDLEEIAKAAEYVLVLAYDAEGYIIWKRTK